MEIKIAIISALSALCGSLIPTVFSYLSNKEQRDFELKKELFNRQKDLYVELFLVLQNMMNVQGNDEFIKLQEAAIKISTFGAYEPSQAFNKYYIQLIRSAQNTRAALTPQEHQEHQKTILNTMRQAMDLEPLDDFELIAFRPVATS
ncbi:MAG: hypothetical protein WC714_29650 [Candidatus Obscuribacterales bacterium]|jgi:hypothetical protein